MKRVVRKVVTTCGHSKMITLAFLNTLGNILLFLVFWVQYRVFTPYENPCVIQTFPTTHPPDKASKKTYVHNGP